MTILIAKLSLMIAVPLATVIVWQRITRSHWAILLFAFGAFAINYLVQIPLNRFLPQLISSLAELVSPLLPIVAGVGLGLWLFWILKAFVLGLFRESIRWLVLRYAVTNVKSWQDGVLFGIGYSSIAMLTWLGDHVYDIASDSMMGMFQPSLDEVVISLNNSFFFHWMTILFSTWRWGVTSMIFNVGTCLAVLFSVQRRDIRPFLAAVGFYCVYSLTPTIIFYSRLGQGWLSSPFSRIILLPLGTLLGTFLVALLSFLLIFRLRKTMGEPLKRDSLDNPRLTASS